MGEGRGFGHGEQRWCVPHAKLVPPRVPARFVEREELREELAHGVAARDVTLLCAPAGYGKTLLLADWIERTGKADKAWVFLDGEDDSPERLLAAILCAIRDCEVVPVDSSLRGLAPPRDGDVASRLADLVDGIDALPHRLHLVVDDIHEVIAGPALHVLDTLVRHKPRNLRLVLASRADPALPLARWRVEGRLSELRAERLRFSLEEAAELMRKAGIDLREDQVCRLVDQTDGWAAGLRLAARSLSETDDADSFLTDCASNDRAIADFFAGEVLVRLAPNNRRLLRMLSVCEDVTPRLASWLSGQDDAGRVLAGLERESSLVAAFGEDRQCFRIHPLLRAYLRADLSRHEPGLADVLHRRAASWYTAEGMPMRALQHAEHTGDEQTVVALLHDAAAEILVRGEPELVRRGLAAVAGRVIAEDPLLLLFSALAHLESGELAVAESTIARVEAIWPGEPDGELVALRQLTISAHALACGRAAVRAGRPMTAPGRTVGCETWLRLDRGIRLGALGEIEAARGQLLATEQVCRENGLEYLLMHCRVAQAWTAALAGDYAGMETASEEALTIARGGGWERSPWLACAEGLIGLARLVRLDTAGAVAAVEAIAGAEPPAIRFIAGIVGGIARFDKGDLIEGIRLLQANRRELSDRTVPVELAAVAALAEHECGLRAHHPGVAREAAEWGRARIGRSAEWHLMDARTAFARGDLVGSAAALRQTCARGTRTIVPMTQVESRLLEAAIALRGGRRTQARAALAAALSLGSAVGIVRPFGHADAGVRRLLLDQIGGFGAVDAFARRVRDVLTGSGANGGVLTGRERAVLARLTLPLPLDEVASELRVSVNTVKTHVRAIYAKLGVNNRRAAVVAARERGLG